MEGLARGCRTVSGDSWAGFSSATTRWDPVRSKDSDFEDCVVLHVVTKELSNTNIMRTIKRLLIMMSKL